MKKGAFVAIGIIVLLFAVIGTIVYLTRPNPPPSAPASRQERQHHARYPHWCPYNYQSMCDAKGSPCQNPQYTYDEKTGRCELPPGNWKPCGFYGDCPYG